MEKKDRRSECTSTLLSRTNRQFYVRRKKSPEEMVQLQIGKVLKSIVNKKQKYTSSRKRYDGMLTEKREDPQVNANVTNMYTYTKSQDRLFEIVESKRALEIGLRKVNPGMSQLLKSFEKCLGAESLEQLQFHQVDFYQTFNQIVLIEIEKSKGIERMEGNMIKNRSNKENAIIFENTKLQKQNVLLRKQIVFYENCVQNKEALPLVFPQNGFTPDPKAQDASEGINMEKFGKNLQQLRQNPLMVQKKLQVKTQEYEILKRQCEAYKQEIYLLRDEKKSLKERIHELKIKNEHLCSQIISFELKNKKVATSDDQKQNIMMMQREEIQSYQIEMHELKKLYGTLNKKYKSLIVKFRKTTSDNSTKIGAMLNRQMEMFPEQFEAFEEVRAKVKDFNKINLNQESKDKKTDKTHMYQQFLGPKQSMNNREGVKKSYSMGIPYHHPTFYGLITEDISFFGIDQRNFQHFNQSIKLNFIGTMRAIMDSRFNDFILNRLGTQTPSFPAFALAWLNSFQINKEKKVEHMPESISTRETICTFYANLMSEKLNYSWEVIAFREFLLETFQTDELFFYLSVRNFLIGGDMSENLSYCFEEVYYIDYNRAVIGINKVIKENDNETKTVFEEFLKRSIVYIRKKAYVELHYLLRILLEYYQGLKEREIERIQMTINMIVQGRKNSLGLLDFQRIFDFHFEFLSFTQIIELYRRCFCVGSGNITSEIVISVFMQENIFLKWVETITCASPIRIEEVENVDWDINYIITPNVNWLYDHERKFRFIYKTQLQRQSQMLGIERFLSNVKKSFKLSSQNSFTRLQMCFDACMMYARKQFFSGRVNHQQLETILDPLVDFLSVFSKITLRKHEIATLMRDLKYKAAGGKIVRFYQKKKAEMTRSIIYAYSPNVDRDLQQQKSQVLRVEFMQLIEEAKEKKIAQSRRVLDQI